MKVKNGLKKTLACMLAVVLMLTGAPLAGIADLDLSGVADWFSTTAQAAEFTEGVFKYTVSDGKATITKCDTSISGELVIPSTLGGYPVTSIGNYAFRDCTGLASITIPNSVTSIGDYAFYNCTGLTSITIPNSVTSIYGRAFYGCTGLTSITIPDSVTSIDSEAFSGCTGLTSITISGGVTSIGDWAFSGFTGLTSVTIPDSVTSIGSKAFKGCTGLTSITIPDSVTSIGDYAFEGCTGLTNITIGNSVRSIGYDAFENCSNLTSVTIPDSVTSIGSRAFYFCDKLSDISIPDSVTSIGSDAFYGTSWYSSQPKGVVYAGKVLYKYKGTMPDNTSIVIWEGTKSIAASVFSGFTGLTSVTIPNSVTSIGGSAFSGCTGLTKINWNAESVSDFSSDNYIFSNAGTAGDGIDVIFGDNVNNIPAYLFYDSSSSSYVTPKIKSVTIGNSVTSIGDSAFENCSNLTSVTIGNSVTSIGVGAFNSCSGLMSVTIPDSVTSIGGGAFGGCSGLTSVKIPDSVTSIGGGAFYNTAWYDSQPNGVVYAGKVLYKYKGTMPDNTSIVIPEGIKGIAGSAFNSCTGLTSVTIPDSVTSIGGSAFDGCTGLASITIPDSVTSIGGWAFYGCTGLTSVTIPDSVTSIGEGAFSHCTGLTSITIPDSVTSIGGGAFGGCSGLTSVKIPDSVTSIGEATFHKCTDLTSITIPDSVTSIGDYAFCYCYDLTSVTIGNSVTSIGEGAFGACTGLTSITIPDSVTSIGSKAFDGCTGLASITIPNSVTSIGDYAFYNCTGLTSVTIGNSVTSIGSYAFSYCTGLTSITIPNSVTSIGSDAFRDCTGLTSVTIGNGVTSIGSDAFMCCRGLTSITIPDSVTSIYGRAFYGCTGLTSITIPDSVTSIDSEAFSGCTGLKAVYYAGTEEQWDSISIGYDNDCLKNTKIVYNGASNNSEFTTGDVGITDLYFCVRKKNASVEGSVMNIEKLTDEVHSVLKDAKALAYPSSTTFTVAGDDRIKIPYGDGKDGITFSVDKYNDYIIPKMVAESFMYHAEKKNDYNETIYMTRDKEDGKPYVSSVYAKSADADEVYTNLVDGGSAYSVKRDEAYDVVLSAGNVKGDATYYIAQDNSPSHTLSNSTGVFSSASFKNFDKNKTIYAWVVAKNGGSEQIALKTKIVDIEDNAFYKSLKNGKYSFGGADGIKVTFPEDWVLIGGTDLDMSAFNFPAQCTYDPALGTLRVAVGLAKYNPTADPTKDEKTWSLFKNEMAGFSKEAEKWKEGMMDYKVLQVLQKCGYPKDMLKEIGREKKFEASGNVMLAIEFSLQNGEFVLKEGYGAIEAKVKASMDGQYAAVVYGISGGADGSFGLTASRQVCSNNAPLSWNLKLSLTPNLKVYAGVGIQDVASASAYGLLKLPFNWSFSQKHIDIALSGEVGLEVKVFVFKTDVPLLSGTLGPANFYYGKKKSNAPMRAPILPSISSGDEKLLTYEPQSRDYAENTSAWLGEAKAPAKAPNRIKAASTTANGITIKNLQTSVYDNSNAKVITCGDTTIATWVEDDASRDEYNRTRLVYSVYDANNDTWSAPKAVCDDGFMDANPYLATDGTDIYVAWQKLCKTFNAENSLTDSDILSAGEIYLAKYDKAADSFVDSVRLTNDSVYDYNPVVTIKNGSPVVYYCTSDGNSMSEASGNKITKYSNGNAVIINDNLSTVYNIDVCGDELAYAVDTDGDVKTTDDIRTFYGETTFSKFESNAEQSEMNFAFGKLDGKDTLFVSDGSNIYYNGDGELKTVLEENTSITGQINAVNVGDKLSIFWTQENDVGNEIYTCSYANGKWSGATQSTSRNNKFTNISIAAASNGKIVGMCNETMRELDETEGYYVDKASNLVTFTAKDYFDMTLLYAGINESELVPGQTAKIYATVENNGNIEANNFEIVITDGYGTEIVTEVAEPLDAGKKNTYEFDYLVPEEFEGGDINVGVDDEFDVDSSDNVFTFGIDTPNLVISNNTVSNSGSLYTIDAVVNNTNFTTAKDVTFKAYFGSTEGEPFDSISIGDLSREQYKNIQFSFTENDIITDENGSRFVYLIVEDVDGNDSQLVISLNELDTVCGHPVTEERAEIPATCTEIGCAAGVFCTACETFVSGGEEIPAKGHTEETVPAVPATCTETGLTEGKKCSVCGTITVEQTIIPLLPHTDENNDAVCDICGQSMSDILPGETKNVQIAENEITYLKFIPAVSGTYTFQSNSSSDTYGYLYDESKNQIASNDDGGSGSNFKITYDLAKGTTYYFGCKFYGSSWNAGSFDVTLTLDKTAECVHDYVAVVTEPTCTTDGYTTYTCSICGKSYIDSIIPALGHDIIIDTESKKPTCTEDGTTEEKHCTRCDYKSGGEVIPALGHTEEIISGISATCITAGLTEGKKCSVCSEVLVDLKVLPALGHDIVIDVEAKDPTCTESGTTEGKHCTRCDYKVEAEEIEPLGHTDDDHDGKCDTCGDTIYISIENCKCNCHKKGIVKFFFKIGLFFQKIFKKNRICKCGVWHY